MRWRGGFLGMALALALATVGSQDAITAVVTLEPVRVTVGDPISLVISVQHDAAASLQAPTDLEAFAPLDLIDVFPIETREIGGGRSETTFEYQLAAFIIGEVELEPLAITSGGSVVLRVEPEPVIVESVVPPDEVVQLRDLKPLLAISTGPPRWIWAALFMAGFALVFVFTMVLARVPTMQSPAAPEPPLRSTKELPGEAAERALDEIAEDELLDEGALRVYYRRISETLRAYLARRFDVPAVAMTPTELEERLDRSGMDKLAARQAVNTLQQCQSVQYAGYEPARERAEADLSAAYEIVRLTSQKVASEA